MGLTLICSGMLFAGGAQEAEEAPAAGDVEPTSEVQGADEPITVIDCYGKEVVITKPIERIVTLDASGLPYAIKAIHGEDKIVGVPDKLIKMKTLFPTMSSLASVGESRTINYEALLMLDPDLILATYWTDAELEEKLGPDIQVLRLNVGPPLTYAEDLAKLGKVFGREKEAAEFIDWCNKQLTIVTERAKDIPEAEKPRVFDFYGGEYGAAPPPPYGTFGKENFWAGPLIGMAGGINVSGELDGDWITVDSEWVITENPDIIVREVLPHVSGYDAIGYEATDFSIAGTMRDELLNKSALETTEAVKSGNVYMIDSNLEQCLWFVGLHYIAKWYHPELFSDLDPAATHQEFLSRFLRIDYDVSSQGVFEYPQL